MTKRELLQLRSLKAEIAEEQKRLSYMMRVYPLCDARIKAMKAQIDLHINQCYDTLSKLQAYIQGIPDSELRRIFSMRYIDGLSWMQIAIRTGSYDEQVPRKKHDKYLRREG